jgi:hypothetical protein
MIRSKSGSKVEVDAVEQELVSRGFRRRDILNENDLNPGEYLRSSYSGTSDRFEGPVTQEIRWIDWL